MRDESIRSVKLIVFLYIKVIIKFNELIFELFNINSQYPTLSSLAFAYLEHCS